MRNLFNRFFNAESSGGWLLLSCIAAALIIANSPAAGPFDRLLHTAAGRDLGIVTLRYPVLTWINDGLMAVFFLLMGLEVKRAFLAGELSGFRKAALPVFAALGGCIAPAAIFALINSGAPWAKGWAIPMATDIAFALTVLRIAAGRRAGSMRSFLSALAIADDICAILVIALFYSGGIHLPALLAAGGIYLLMLVLNRLGVQRLWCYLLPGILLWYFLHHSGVHATIAGVLTAFAIPLKAGKNGRPPLEKLEYALLKPVNFLILPLFTLANANISFVPEMLDGLASPLSAGIIAGLLIGKPLGIVLFSFLTVKMKAAVLPADMSWKHILAVSIIAGIGFTMSIFVSMLSYDQAAAQVQAKLSILLASTLAGIIGYCSVRALKQ